MAIAQRQFLPLLLLDGAAMVELMSVGEGIDGFVAECAW